MIVEASAKPVDEETSRMKRAKLAEDPRGKDKEPAFLRAHKKQKTGSTYADIDPEGVCQVNVKSAVFRPTWGFRKQDSVVGSTKHSADWSLNSITPSDYKDFVTGGKMEEAELLGSQAIAAANVHFQGLIHQSKAWRGKARAFETESQKRALRIKELEEKLSRKEEELSEAHAELVALKAGKEEMIDEYMDSAEFKTVMDKHDELLFPVQYTQGWNEAIEAVGKRHPGLMEASDLLSPYLPLSQAPNEDEEEDEEDTRILDPNVVSPLQKATASDSTAQTSPSSTPKKAVPSSPTSSSSGEDSEEESEDAEDTGSKKV